MNKARYRYAEDLESSCMDKMLEIEDLVKLASFPGPILRFSTLLLCRIYVENIAIGEHGDEPCLCIEQVRRE